MKSILALALFICLVQLADSLRTWREYNGVMVFKELSTKQGHKKWAQYKHGKFTGWFDLDDGGDETVSLLQYQEPGNTVKNYAARMFLTPSVFYTLRRKPNDITGEGTWDLDRTPQPIEQDTTTPKPIEHDTTTPKWNRPQPIEHDTTTPEWERPQPMVHEHDTATPKWIRPVKPQAHTPMFHSWLHTLLDN